MAFISRNQKRVMIWFIDFVSFEAIAVAFDVYDLAVMEYAVEYSRCDHSVTEQLLQSF